ncbi:MAG: hypothetical protein MI867_17430, partial [Pseudomonadales bacterium]|nr:hypothetical protein [Pseudomonadales bacterium]
KHPVTLLQWRTPEALGLVWHPVLWRTVHFGQAVRWGHPSRGRTAARHVGPPLRWELGLHGRERRVARFAQRRSMAGAGGALVPA